MIHCVFDLETGSTNPETAALLQISGEIYIDGELEHHFDHRVQPFEDHEVTPQTLSFLGVDPAELRNSKVYLPPGAVFKRLKDIFSIYVDPYDKNDKMYLVGYNCQAFDYPIFRRWWLRNGDKYFGSWFWFPTHDVMLLWGSVIDRAVWQPKDFKLSTLAKLCGIKVEEEKLHDALYDVRLTAQLYWLYRELYGGRDATATLKRHLKKEGK